MEFVKGFGVIERKEMGVDDVMRHLKVSVEERVFFFVEL